MGRRRMTTSDFISRAKLVHGSVYAYNVTVFTRSDEPVMIMCKRHGNFTQIASNHLKGYGCNTCGHENQRTSPEDFLTTCRGVHGETYTYYMNTYVNNTTKMEIECKHHGVFLQNPNKHLSGSGCPKCANKYITTQEFIEKAQHVHGIKYDYSESVYLPGGEKILIKCKTHGSFKQSPYNHTSNKQGCPKCKHEKAKSNFGVINKAFFENDIKRKEIPAIFYKIRCFNDSEDFFKMGITSQNILSRMYSIPYNIEILEELQGSLYDMWLLEQKTLKNTIKYKPKKRFSGWTECFIL